ncbi:hypothetical protein AQUCO_06800012v1 [Aquilegia coerulea]|uniref:Uncharacterized protein n=1 Tax=Aquilegia coerulea TaxID=218851 RepID=A0A2G5CBA2_AQUCA|nr:hypothetical protein AQUCO_06800012v1 [Aquilegia coerulea]
MGFCDDVDDRFKSFYIMNPIIGQYQQVLPNFVISGDGDGGSGSGSGDTMLKMKLISSCRFFETEEGYASGAVAFPIVGSLIRGML